MTNSDIAIDLGPAANIPSEAAPNHGFRPHSPVWFQKLGSPRTVGADGGLKQARDVHHENSASENPENDCKAPAEAKLHWQDGKESLERRPGLSDQRIVNHGLDSGLRPTSATSISAEDQTVFDQTPEYDSVYADSVADTETLGEQTTPEPESNALARPEPYHTKETYAELSKRADIILENAKKRLRASSSQASIEKCIRLTRLAHG